MTMSDNPHDWTDEEFPADYVGTCASCKTLYSGHKGRAKARICKRCHGTISRLNEAAPSLTPEQNKTQQQLRPLILAAMERVGGYECARGWLRYEAIKRLQSYEFDQILAREQEGERFDDMIDQLLTEH